MKHLLWLLALAACAPTSPAPSPRVPVAPPKELSMAADVPIRAAVDRILPPLLDLYRWFHANPELSFQETETARRFAGEVARAGWTVREKVGGTGVLAWRRNGEGPTLLVRVDMDALPVREETGLPYAAKGDVMHACGHDVHLAAGVGLAQVLAAEPGLWRGTVLLVGQPGEEMGTGSLRMLEDPAFDDVLREAGRPSWCLSLHDSNDLPAGSVGICPGWAFANVDTIDITVRGRGGHGSRPHQTVDPVVVASEIVLSLQTIVSRRVKPGVPAVITVGSIHGGTKHNIIPDEVKLQLTVRSFADDVRARLLEEIRRTAESVAAAHGAPSPPVIEAEPDYCPASYNDPDLSRRMAGVFEAFLGADRVRITEPVTGGEDFGRFARRLKVPGLQYWVGGVDPAVLESGAPVPPMHSSRWAPAPEPTLRTAVATLARAVAELLPAK